MNQAVAMTPRDKVQLPYKTDKYQGHSGLGGKGHEAFLKTLEKAGSVVMLEELDTGAVVSGVIKASDKYTISLKISEMGGGYQTYVFFKHGIKKFWVKSNNQLAS